MNCNKKIKKRGKNFTHFLNFDEKPNKELHNLFDFSSPTEKSYTECQEKPTTVRATYTKDFNLICIHNLVRSKFIHDQKDIPRIEEKIESNNRLLQNSKLSPLERNIIIKEKQDLCQKYEEIMTLKEWNKYVDLSVPILSNYLKVMSNETKGIFIIGRDDDEDEKTLELRFYYIESYLEVISSLPEDWAQTPLWKDASSLPWCHVTEGLAELPEALRQTASHLLMKHKPIDSSGVDQGSSSQPQQLPSPPQQLSQQPPSQEMKRPRQQESPQASSSRPRRAIQVGLLSPPELSSEHQVSRPKPSGSSSNGNQKKKFRAKRPQKTHPKAIDVATSS